MRSFMLFEERIRELCARAVAARDMDEMVPILSELRTALHEHAEQLRTLLGEYPLAPVRSMLAPSAMEKTGNIRDTNTLEHP